MNHKEIDIILKSRYFDFEFYCLKSSKKFDSITDGISHYLDTYLTTGLDPSKEFQTNYYLTRYQDVAKAGINPLIHFIRAGEQEGRLPNKSLESVVGLSSDLPRFGGKEYGPVKKFVHYDKNILLDDGLVPKICVHLHLFHDEMKEVFCDYLKNIHFEFTLLLSTSTDDNKSLEVYFKSRVSKISNCVAKKFPNVGRDVAPWVVGFRREIENSELFLHLHSKKSDYNTKYKGWRRFLIHHVIGSSNIVNSILNEFIQDKSIGVIYPPYFSALPGQPNWGANKKLSNNLLNKMRIPTLDQCPDFPSGSFFWARADALKPIFDLKLGWNDFDKEEGQLDGTLGHAVERVICEVGKKKNYNSICLGIDVAFNLINYWDPKRINFLKKDSVLFNSKQKPLSSNLIGKKIAVFTCITGNFDGFCPVPCIDEGVDYFIFSDNEFTVPNPYQFKQCKYFEVSTRRMARFVKTHPHFLLADYDVAVWIDGNIIPRNGVQEIVEKVLKNKWSLGIIAHPVRDDYRLEVEECIRIAADEPKVIASQLEFYDSQNINMRGLIETNIIVSDLTKADVSKFYNIWWAQINNFSLRDQLSVIYALEKSGINYGYIFEEGVSARDHKDYSLIAHGVKTNVL